MNSPRDAYLREMENYNDRLLCALDHALLLFTRLQEALADDTLHWQGDSLYAIASEGADLLSKAIR